MNVIITLMKTLQQWEQAVSIYDQNMGEEGDSFNKNSIGPAVLSMLGNYKNKTILDSGCGSGYFTAFLAGKAKNVTGTDFSQKFVDVCNKKYGKIKNLDFVLHDVSKKMPFQEGTFDIIISKMVLQYVEDLNMFANESIRVLKKVGQLIVAVDHPFNTQFYYAQQVAGKPNPRYGVLNDYFDGRAHTKLSLWNKVMLTWYPKTMSGYITPFIKRGFSLVDILESPEEKNNIRIPRVLTTKFKK